MYLNVRFELVKVRFEFLKANYTMNEVQRISLLEIHWVFIFFLI